MKAFNTIVKILAAIAAITGVVYVIATYGDKIVAWAKKMLASCPCKCDVEDCADCQCEAECPCEEPAEEPVEVAEDAPAEEPAEEAEEEEIFVEATEPAPAAEPVAEETDFAE